MASRTSTDPIEILLEMGVDLDDLSEQDYLGALMEAVATIEFQTKGKGDARSAVLRKEIIEVRKKRKATDPKFKARKTKISADTFKKGSAAGVKITPKALPTSAIVPYQAPGAEEEGEEKKKRKRKPKEKNLLAEIAASVTNIADTLKKQYNLKKKEGEFDRKKAQRDRRKLAKENLKKGFGSLFKTAEKIVKPVRSIFDRIFGFITNILIGKFLMKLVGWFGDPQNRKKISNIIEFLGKNWPKLLSLYLVFGTGLGRFVFSLTKTLITGAVRLTAAIAKLLAAKKLRGAGRVARFLGGRKGRLIGAAGATALTVGGTYAGINALGFSGGGSVEGYSEGGQAQGNGSSTFRFAGIPNLGGIINKLYGRNRVGYEEGGDVDSTSGTVEGPGGTDKVPAMLTAGEFVMSRGAVQKYGIKTLEGMNSAGGGTNQPKIVDNKLYASVGGYVGDADLGKRGTPDPEYSKGSLMTNPLGALDRILGQSTGGKVRLPMMESKPSSQPKSQPKPKSKPKETLTPQPKPIQETSADQTAGGIPEKMLKSDTFRDSGLLYLRSMLGGLGGPITEQDLSKASKDELNKAIARAKKRTSNELSIAKRQLAEAKAGGFNKQMLAERQSVVNRLERGEVRVEYQDYYENGKISKSAEDAKSILGKFWAAQTNDGGYKVVNEKYDFVEMPDPMAVLMGDSSGVSKNAKPGQPITLRQRLQALHQINPLAREMSVDMILGGKSDPGRDIKNIMTKLGGIVDFFTLNSFDLDNQGGPTLLNPSGKEQTPAEPIEEKTKKKLDSKPKLTAQQIKNNQAYAASKGKYYSSTTGKTYASYSDALKDPEVASAAKKIKQSRRMSTAKMMNNNSSGIYYSSTTGKTYANYTEALKDPQVAAAAQLEKTKQRFSFSPNQNVNYTSPEPPQNPAVTVVKVPSTKPKGGQRAAPRGGSQTPDINAGNGSNSKRKILGIF
jgi:hypothetical protein